MAIEPVTRKERILSGEDIEPVTRLEYFLKNSGGGGGGGGVFRVDMLYDEETDSLRSSKTATEIISALNSGLLPYLFDSDENAIYPLTFINNVINIADFTLVTAIVNGTSQTISGIAVNKYTVDANGSIQAVSGQRDF